MGNTETPKFEQLDGKDEKINKPVDKALSPKNVEEKRKQKLEQLRAAEKQSIAEDNRKADDLLKDEQSSTTAEDSESMEESPWIIKKSTDKSIEIQSESILNEAKEKASTNEEAAEIAEEKLGKLKEENDQKLTDEVTGAVVGESITAETSTEKELRELQERKKKLEQRLDQIDENTGRSVRDDMGEMVLKAETTEDEAEKNAAKKKTIEWIQRKLGVNEAEATRVYAFMRSKKGIQNINRRNTIKDIMAVIEKEGIDTAIAYASAKASGDKEALAEIIEGMKDEDLKAQLKESLRISELTEKHLVTLEAEEANAREDTKKEKRASTKLKDPEAGFRASLSVLPAATAASLKAIESNGIGGEVLMHNLEDITPIEGGVSAVISGQLVTISDAGVLAVYPEEQGIRGNLGSESEYTARENSVFGFIDATCRMITDQNRMQYLAENPEVNDQLFGVITQNPDLNDLPRTEEFNRFRNFTLMLLNGTGRNGKPDKGAERQRLLDTGILQQTSVAVNRRRLMMINREFKNETYAGREYDEGPLNFKYKHALAMALALDVDDNWRPDSRAQLNKFADVIDSKRAVDSDWRPESIAELERLS